MVNSVNGVTTPNRKTSIFYVNDIHAQTTKMEQIATASDIFQRQTSKSGDVDPLTLTGGDIMLGANPQLNKAAVDFLNLIKTDATTLGNHEFDSEKLGELLGKANFKVLSANIDYAPNSDLSKRTVRSTVKNINGTNYGIIGIQPTDLRERVKNKQAISQLTISNQDETIEKIKKEVAQLEKRGINRIILLSHSGINFDKKIAQNVSGIDVIIGGHSHDLIESITPKVNLVYSPKKEPVIITQAGRDGEHFGVLNLEFDDKGVIKVAQNNLHKSSNFSPNFFMRCVADRYLGPTENVGIANVVDIMPKKVLKEENPFANIICDAIRSELDTDIAFLNSANVRGSFSSGTVTNKTLMGLSPFYNKMCKVKISEADIVNAISDSGVSITKPDGKPGILQVSGLEYALSKDGKLKSLSRVTKDGKKIPIDIKNPSREENLTAAYDDFLARGNETYKALSKMDKLIGYYDFDKGKLLVDYVKKFNNKPFDVKKDGRIIVEK